MFGLISRFTGHQVFTSDIRNEDEEGQSDEDGLGEAIVAPRGGLGQFGKDALASSSGNKGRKGGAPPAKRRGNGKGADRAESEVSKTGSYVYGADDGASVLASLDDEMKQVAAKCKNYPKQIPACLQNLNILRGELLGRSISKAGSRVFVCVGSIAKRHKHTTNTTFTSHAHLWSLEFKSHCNTSVCIWHMYIFIIYIYVIYVIYAIYVFCFYVPWIKDVTPMAKRIQNLYISI